MSAAERWESAAAGYAPLVEVSRGDATESIHMGAIAWVDAAGRAIASVGRAGATVVLRSTAKPAQVLPLIDSGAAARFGFADEALAVMTGSHGGEPFHVRAVATILETIGLDESALQCGAHAPYHRPSAAALRAAGREPGPLHNNCSGKHAGMLAQAVHLNAPVDRYLEPDHPVQTAIRRRLEALTGGMTSDVLVDGCSAPTFAVPLSGLALLYARLAEAEGGRDAALGRAAGAMRAHPLMVAGSDRLCTVLMSEGAAARLIAKIGAEGVYGLGWVSDGRGQGLALKIGDGEGERARTTTAVEALRQAGVLSHRTAAALRDRFVGEVRNHRGRVVGRVAPVFALRAAML